MTTDSVIIDKGGLNSLIEALAKRGFRVVGPTLRDNAIVYDDIASVADLPEGWSDEQDGGQYRLEKRGDGALFGYTVGPHSWKRFLHPPIQQLWKARRKGFSLTVEEVPPESERFALFGVRACEMHAIAIQDRVLTGGAYADPHYRARRQNAFLVALNCGKAGGTCFCVSMKAGPRVPAGFDLALTELLEGGHRFVVEAGSEAGREILAELPQRPAAPEDLVAAEKVVEHTAATMGRQMQADGVAALLRANMEHPRWGQVAARCLTCSNCTMVCPTCFCTSVEEASDLAGVDSSRARRWDSCFTIDFSYLHGGTVRPTTRSRYRQWMTHKLSTWWDQFGSTGCVGCGRCITWCPVGIDITEEVAAIASSPSR